MAPISSSGTTWDTGSGYHTFWLYVNKSTKQILAQMDNRTPVNLTLTPLTQLLNHDNLPSGQFTPDPTVFSTTLPTRAE